METLHGSPSFTLQTPEVSLAVTRTGGHLAPLTYHLPGLDASPLALAPWKPSEVDASLPRLLAELRGDFLCLPFGGQRQGPPHGETANGEWALVARTERRLELGMQAGDTGARVAKRLSVVAGHHAVYTEHLIEGLQGEWNYGTHAILDLSGLPEGAARISISPFRFGSVYPGEFSPSGEGATGCLLPGGRFDDLAAVPLKSGAKADLSRYPARKGNDDLVMLTNVPAEPTQPFAWTAASLPGYAWVQLKRAADFPSTLLWMSNGGRAAHPWEGRHLGRIGLEEVCSHFCDGVDLAREDRLASLGIPTARTFRRGETTRLPLIQMATPTPPGFGRVATVAPEGDGAVRVADDAGNSVVCPLDWNFLLR
jgi:hypothetical protein